MEQWIWDYVRASGAPDITSLRAALTTTPPDQLLQLITTIRSESYTALLLAISWGHPEVAHLVLTPLRGIADELLFEKVEGGSTALYRAVLKRDRELVELILRNISSGKKYKLIAEKSERGWTALTEAAVRGYTEVVETLLISLSVEQRVSLLNIQIIHVNTALHLAASWGHTATLQAMLTSIPPDKVSALLSIKNSETHAAATFSRFAALHEADRHKTEELTNLKEALLESHRQIVALKEADSRKTAELINHKDELAALKEADSQKAEDLANQSQELVESQRQIVALQAVNNQLTADTAAIKERLNRLDIYLRAPTDTDETGDQLHYFQG
ncbi:uncharacterized protein [Watersipora subatra]|uniref:uncharacterized protein n=1 Tax=Watersipora subatra TaxID=2589382 RepID=UPI00355C11BB